MVTATRKQFIELENGDIQFSVVVARDDVDALLALAPYPGLPLELTPPIGAQTTAALEFKPLRDDQLPKAGDFSRKPPTQTVAPAGESHGAFGMTGSREARQALELCNHPWFQQYVRAQVPSVKDPDDLEVAKTFMAGAIAPTGRWTTESVTLLQGVMKHYKSWCQAKGYTNG